MLVLGVEWMETSFEPKSHQSISGGIIVYRHLRHVWPARCIRPPQPHQPLLRAGLPRHGGPGTQRVLSHVGQPSEEVQQRRRRANVLPSVPHRLLGRSRSVVSVAKSDDGPLVTGIHETAIIFGWSEIFVQYTWFRRLYMLFSRYTLINTLEPMSRPGGAEKKDS